MSTIEKAATTTLAVDGDYWNDAQMSVLQHMGISRDVTRADLQVFHHVCRRTQLDPFMRQIHMVGRNTKDNGQWVTKYTIQTGIDGFRVIGRRAATEAGDSLAVSAPEWLNDAGKWLPAWRHEWGYPVAARVTIERAGHAHTGVALWDEYRQTKKDGGLTSMWETRRAGQLAKCAEALAWRMACPYDLAGMYTDEEMGQADNAPAPQRSASGLAAALAEPEPVVDGEAIEVEAEPVETGELLDTSSSVAKRMFALFGEVELSDKADRLAYCSSVAGRPIESSTELTTAEAEAVIAQLLNDKEAS